MSTSNQLLLNARIHCIADSQRSCPNECLFTVGIWIKRILVMCRGKAWRNNSIFRLHIKLDKIKEQIQGCLILQIATGDADRQNRAAIFQHKCGCQRNAGTLAGLDAVWVSRNRVETSQAVSKADARRATHTFFAVDVGRGCSSNYIAPAVSNNTGGRSTNPWAKHATRLQRLHVLYIARTGFQRCLLHINQRSANLGVGIGK